MNLLVLALVLLVGRLVGGAPSDFDVRLAPIVRPHVFSLAAWQFQTIIRESLPFAFRRNSNGDISTVLQYFKNVEMASEIEDRADAAGAGAQAELARLREDQQALAGPVQEIIEKQITDTLRGQGIYSPFGGRFSFPPVNFKLATPPNLLVVSPRDRIESMSETMLQPEITTEDIDDIEVRVDQLDVSSLVTGIGGLGATYPAFVADDMDLRATIKTSAHEWLHQYLAFKPLGFRYILDLIGIARSRDITSMNETLADIVGREIGDLVFDRYYGRQPSADSDQSEEGRDGDTTPEPTIDFNAEMRGIRRQVDLYLSQGQVDEAEQHMRERRDYLASHGYYIRKLNQAYFAFYGSYTDSPTSVDPIGLEMKQLRSQSGSLKRFLDRASAMTSRQALGDAAGRKPND